MPCPVSKERLSLLTNSTNYTYMVLNMNTKIINNFVISDVMKAYDSAVKEIESLLLSVSSDLHLAGGSYSLTESAPESYKSLVESTVDKHIFIASYGCDTTIYSKPLFNHLFRFGTMSYTWYTMKTSVKMERALSPLIT